MVFKKGIPSWNKGLTLISPERICFLCGSTKTCLDTKGRPHWSYLDRNPHKPICAKCRLREYRKKKPEISRNAVKKYIQANPEKTKLRLWSWRQKNPHYERQRLKKLGIFFNKTAIQYRYALETWSLLIRRKSKNICQICGEKAEISHHLLYKKLYPKLSLNQNNGIALCKQCHNEAHGYKIEVN